MSPLLAKESLSERLVSFAWNEWAQIGLLIAPAHVSPWAQDPEALIVFTLQVARDEPRLFDELLDWMLGNELCAWTRQTVGSSTRPSPGSPGIAPKRD